MGNRGGELTGPLGWLVAALKCGLAARDEMMTSFPRPATVYRMLQAPTPADLVALDAAWSHVQAWCAAADADESVAVASLRAVCARAEDDTPGTIGRLIRRTVSHVWNDNRDSHPDSRGRLSLSDGMPEGAIDVCRGAGVVACALVGLIEPTDDLAAIMERWYRECCKSLKATVSVDLGPVDMVHPRNALAAQVESESRWPGEPTPFRAALDEIAGGVLRA